MLRFEDRTRALLAAVRRHGNVSSAAREVGWDPANARRHIRIAERRSGTELVALRRGGSDGRNAALTPAGRALLRSAKPTGIVEAYDRESGCTSIVVGARKLYAAGVHRAGPAEIEITPESVAIARRVDPGASPRNALAATVESIAAASEGIYRVRLATGALKLEARVVRSAVKEMRLRKGSRVFAIVKAVSIVVRPIDT